MTTGERKSDRTIPSTATGTRAARTGWTVAIVVCFALTGFYVYDTHRQEVNLTRIRLQLVADAREAAVLRWTGELVADLSVVAAEPLVGEFLARPDRRPDDRLIRFLATARERHRLEGLILYDREAVERYRIGEPEPPAFPHNAGFAAQAIASRTPTRVFIHAHAARGPIRIGLAVPVLNEAGDAHGALAIEQDPQASLYPIVLDDPMLSASLETLFLRPLGEGVRFVSPLRFHPEWGIGHVLETPAADLAGRIALSGREEFGRFTDYRGRPVYAVTRWIEETGWGMVVKMDRSEALEAWRNQVLLFLLALGGLLSASLTLSWGTRKALEERRHREAAERERRFRSLTEQSRDAIAVLQEERLVLANPAFRELWTSVGRDITEGEGLDRLLPPEEVVRLQTYLLDVTTERRRTEPLEVRLEGTAGHPVDIEIQAGPIAFEEVDAVQLVCRDITLRKRAEEHLRLMQFTLDNATDMVAWIRQDGTLAYVNEAFCQATGWPGDRLVGRPIWEVDPLMDAGSWREYWDLVKNRGSASLTSERLARDGSLAPVDISSRFIAFGGREYICSFSRDMTDWRRLEEQLHQSQKMEAVGRLAGGIAHDFNNLLTVITGNVELAFRSLGSEDPLAERLRIILKAANHAAELTR
jgi:PAS domain S-box-containing protein